VTGRIAGGYERERIMFIFAQEDVGGFVDIRHTLTYDLGSFVVGEGVF
jgi:hypothetical protein